MNENQTLDTLEEIIHLIRALDNVYDYDSSMDIKMRLKRVINDAYEDRIISDDMYREYDGLFETELRTGYLNVEALQEITVRNHKIVEEANDKIANSLNWDSNQAQEDEINDSKDVLQELAEAMDRYYSAFSERYNMLDAQEEFCRVGKIIKRALPENKITEKTAKELMEPLQIMKNNMFDPRKQDEAYNTFKDTIARKMDRENEKEGPQQSMAGQEQSQEGVLSSAGTIIGRAIEGVANAFKKINDKIEEDAQRAADEYDKEQAKTLSPEQIKAFENMKNDILRRYKRAKHYADIFSKSEMYYVSGPAYAATAQELEPLAKIAEGIDLNKSYDEDNMLKFSQQFKETMAALPEQQKKLESVNFAFDDVFENLSGLDNSMNQFFSEIGLDQEPKAQKKEAEKAASDKEKDYPNVAQEQKIKQPESQVRQQDPKAKAPEQDVLQQATAEQTKTQEEQMVRETAHTPDLSKKEEAKDIAQEPEDLLRREDIQAKTEQQQDPQTREKALENLREALDKYNEDRNDLDKWRKYWDALHEPVLQDFTEKYFAEGEKLQKAGAGEDALYKQAVEMINKELGPNTKQEVKQQLQGAASEEKLAKKPMAKDIAPEMRRDADAKEQQHGPQTKAEALQKLKDLYAKRYDARLNSSANQANTNIDFFAEMENNPMLKDVAKKYFDLYGQSKAGGVRRDGWFAYKAKEMINNELAKELGQEIQPEDKKISALLDVLYMSDSLQIDKVADSKAYDRMKSALQKLADDKVISPEIMRDYQAIFDAEGRPHLTGAQVMHLENAILGQLDKLESENEKQRQNGKGKTVEPKESQQQVKDKEQQDKFNFNMGQKGPVDQPANQETPHTADLSKKQEVKDVSQKPADLMQREEAQKDKTNEKKQENKDLSQKPEDLQLRQDKVQTNQNTAEMSEALVNALQDVVAKHNDRDPDSFKNMMFAIQDLSKKGLLSEDMKKEYMEVFDRVKELGATDNSFRYGADRLLKVVIEQLDQMDENDNGSHEQTPQERFQQMFGDFNLGNQKAQEQSMQDQSQQPRDFSKMFNLGQRPEQEQANDSKVDPVQQGENEFLASRRPENKDLAKDKSEDQMQREEAQKDKTNEKKQENKDLSQKPDNLLKREDQQKKDENQHKIDNFNKGNQKVVDMDNNKHTTSRQQNNEIALAAYRRKILQGRSNTGNV
jgi:hypothetical protein